MTYVCVQLKGLLLTYRGKTLRKSKGGHQKKLDFISRVAQKYMYNTENWF